MSWNYRIVRHKLSQKDAEVCGYDHYFSLRSVYYTDGDPNGMHAEPDSFVCDAFEGPEGIIKSLKLAIKTYEERGIINEEDITECQARTSSSSTTEDLQQATPSD